MINMRHLNKMAEIYEGLPIWNTMIGSPSHIAGVRQGDILIEANGNKISSAEDYIQHVQKAPSPIELKVVRDNVVMEFTMVVERSSVKMTPEQAHELMSDLVEIMNCDTMESDSN